MKIIKNKKILESEITRGAILFIPENKKDLGLLSGYIELSRFANLEKEENKEKKFPKK